eukprot:TRINITY_DN18725_c0_g6_i1.p1 TRINITY_DN18725_c0_g6~~TRINITY_DN18725_c0_g6_i1.p1  ORF type:complete len:551 (+),score=245.10 TRINITY_DN18725_c0_g6_i1:58-1653(+)
MPFRGDAPTLGLAVSLVLCACAAPGATGFTVEFSAPVKIGASKGPFWRPRGGVDFGTAKAAITIQTKGEGCSCKEGGDAPQCEKGCADAERQVMFTVDGGSRFYTYTGDKEFCGAQSVAAEKDEETVRHCPEQSEQVPDEESITMPVVEWSMSAGGALSSPSLSHARHSDKKVTVWTTAIKRAIPSRVKFGNNILDMKDKKLMFRLATVNFDDEAENVILKSQDSGYSWFHLGSLPLDIGEINALERIGENDLQLHVRLGNNTIVKTQSRTLGRKWSNVTEVTDYHNIPTVVTSRFTTHISGGSSGPVLMSLGGKKGSEKVFNLAKQHNEFLDEIHDFEDEFLKRIGVAKKNDTDLCATHPFPKDAAQCGSTGQVDVVNVGHPEGDKNMTDLLLCYDKLDGGFDSAEHEDSVYCMKARVNETKEGAAHEAKIRKREEKERQEREYRERMEKQQEEMRERKRQQRREKQKKVKEQRAKWERLDAEENIAPAREYQKEDSELVIIRDLTKNAEYHEFIDEAVGIPATEPEEDE